ncbi:MAG: magnesium transporter CorA family protein [Chloroflexi bacterium]|nr:magnesium transporter CorA family protein [Chloroflexota bacterium]
MATSPTVRKDLEIKIIEAQGLTWVNVGHPSLAEMEYLKARYSFHHLDLEDCLSRVQIPKVDEYPNYLFLVVHFPVFNRKARVTLPSQVGIFVGADFVVTVHRGDLRPLVKLFEDCQGSEAIRHECMGQSSGHLLYRILDHLVDYCFPVLNKIIEQVDRLEEGILEPHSGIVQELSIVRRDVIAYRRVIRPQIEVMESLEAKEYPFLRVDPDVYFGDLADHTRRIWVELEELKEVTEGLSDTLFTLNSHLTNDVMRILTVLFTVMLPLIAVSGLYGMNVALPFAGHTWAFAITFIPSIIMGALLFLFFRLKRWI